MIGIVGASGLIGSNLYRYLENKKINVLGTYYSKNRDGLKYFDLNNGDFSIFDECNQVVISGAISSLDRCVTNRNEAYEVNVEKTIELINYLADREIVPVFLSSDQVFDGSKGNYTEDDMPNPVNNYGRFKLFVEEHMKSNLKDFLILRLSKTYSRNIEDGGFFAETFLKLKNGTKIKAAYNQIYNPTDIKVVCDGVMKAMTMNLTGLYHLADSKGISRYDFVLSVAEEYSFDKNLIEPVDINKISLVERRPLNTSLNVEKISKTFDMTE